MRRPRDWVGNTVPSPWTRSYSMGRYNLEFAASAAWGLVSRSRASLSSSRPALVPPRCSLSVYYPGTIGPLAIVPEYRPLRGQVPNRKQVPVEGLENW